ncbi:tyrosine-type recombinase/integrase [Novosphingobium umbonatum]|nr:site-specific integrase [Novosphingobium umbonatum]
MRLRQKDSGIYILDHEVEGVRKRVSLGTRDLVLARKKAQRILMGLDPEEDRLQPAAVEQKTKGVTVDQLFDHVYREHWKDVKSQATILSNLRILSSYIGKLQVTEVTDEVIRDVRKRLEDKGNQSGTVSRKLDSLYKALDFALDWDGGNNTGVPILQRVPRRPKIKKGRKRERVLSADEQALMFQKVAELQAANPSLKWGRIALLLRFLLHTGCRLSEALQVSLDDSAGALVTELGRTWVQFPRYTTKNDKPRRLPLTEDLAAALQDLVEVRRKEIALAKEHNVEHAVTLFDLRTSTAQDYWAKLRKELGPDWKDVCHHSLRHTCLTLLAKQIQIHKVSMWAGHSDVRITMQNYVHLQPEDLLSCVDALDATLR